MSLRGEAPTHVLTRPCRCRSVYSGHQSVLVPPPELETNVSLWLWAVSQYKARVTFCSYSVMEMCARGLGAQTAVLRVRAVRAWREPRTSPSSRKPPRGAPPPAVSSPPRHTPMVHFLGGEGGGRRAGWARPRVTEASEAGAERAERGRQNRGGGARAAWPLRSDPAVCAHSSHR